MKGPFGSISILFVVFAVMLAMAGLIWAHWSTSISVDAQVNTGSVGIHWSDVWTNDDGVVDGWDGGDDGSDGEYSAWGGQSSPDPAGFWEDQGRYPKDVAGCWAYGDEGHISVNIDNGYPSYHCTVNAGLYNTSSIPLKVLPTEQHLVKGERECGWWYGYEPADNTYNTMVEDLDIRGDDISAYVENYWPGETGVEGEFDEGIDWRILGWEEPEGFFFEYVDENADNAFNPGETMLWSGCNFYEDSGLDFVWFGGGEFGWGHYNDAGEFVAEITGWMPEELFTCGQQIEPHNQYWDGGLNFHVEQEADQNATYQWNMYQEFVNYNEFDEAWCDEGPGLEIEPGSPIANDEQKGFGVRYRNFDSSLDNDEVYLGQGDLGDPGRAEQAITWAPDQHVMLRYDGAGTLTTQVADNDPLVKTGIDESCADFLVMSVVARDADTMTELNGVVLNGHHLGDFNATASAWNDWTVFGLDFAEEFQLDAELLIDGPITSSSESNKVELLVGCDLP